MERRRMRKSPAKRADMKKRAVLIGVVLLLLGGFVFFLTKPAVTEATGGHSGVRLVDRTRVCMLQDNIQAQAGLEYEYQGKKYYLCCRGCLAAFQAKAEHYSMAVDPVTGEQVDKASAPIYVYRGRAFFFASDDTLATFAQDPQRYLTAPVH